MRTDTASNIINKVLLELALATSSVANVYASEDAVVIQLRALLESLGQELAQMRPWTHLQKEHTLTTVNGTQSYALPSGFVGMLPQTQWNRSTDLELAGPAGPQLWQLLVSTNTVSTINYFFRVQGNRLFLEPTPTAADALAFEYLSAYWVQPTGETTPTSEAPSDDADTLWFDRRLLVTGLKLRWLEAKGFDTTAAQRAYDSVLSATMGNDGAHAVLYLAPPVLRHGPSLPETDWGV